MIVRDDGDRWQVVLQPDHAELAAQFAQAWTEGRARPSFAGAIAASRRHDDGWLAWEREPGLDADGAPKTFFKVDVRLQFDFYRGVIAALSDLDPYTALLTSMHACGLYGGIHGWPPAPLADDARPQAQRLIDELCERFAGTAERCGVSEADVMADYDLVQVVDRLSLHFCMQPEAGEPRRIERSPGAPDGYTITPVSPGHIVLDPFPFGGKRCEFALRRRLITRRPWPDVHAFRREFAAQAPEDMAVVISAP